MNRIQSNDGRSLLEEANLAECVQYFRSNPEFKRLFQELKEKYRSLGTIGGTIRLDNLQPGEAMALTGLLRKDYSRRKTAELKVTDIAAALDRTKFTGLNLVEVVRAYWDGEIIPKKLERHTYQTRRQEFFARIMEEFPDQTFHTWLNRTLTTGDNAYKLLITRYDQEPERLRRDLLNLGRALNELPVLGGEKLQLSLFASKITSDPHYFDDGTFTGELLVYGLMDIYGISKPQTAVEKAELLYRGGLYNNELMNFTICSGLLGYQPGGAPHQGWLGFYRVGEPLQVSLGSLSRLERVESPGKVVFVVENPVVFSVLLEKWRSTGRWIDGSLDAGPPLVCTNGQVNLAALVLLDLLIKDSGTRLYYSGDFDPEGILIADKLKCRYGVRLHLWRYTELDYRKTISGQKISAPRLKQLGKLKNEELIGLGEVMNREGYAGYQELLVEELWKDVVQLAIDNG